MGGHEREADLHDSSPGARETGGGPGMGVSSERVGRAGPGQVGTEGVRDTALGDPVADEDAPPEQRPGLPEPHPDDVASPDPRHRDPGPAAGAEPTGR